MRSAHESARDRPVSWKSASPSAIRDCYAQEARGGISNLIGPQHGRGSAVQQWQGSPCSTLALEVGWRLDVCLLADIDRLVAEEPRGEDGQGDEGRILLVQGEDVGGQAELGDVELALSPFTGRVSPRGGYAASSAVTDRVSLAW